LGGFFICINALSGDIIKSCVKPLVKMKKVGIAHSGTGPPGILARLDAEVADIASLP
jgi:predicted CDP-diglyceride synthetase/phosphatidate cytidylyltransferase